MNAKQFFDKVAEMRTQQKNYAGTKSPFTLVKLRDLEKEIDNEIERVKNIAQRPTEESKLF